MARYSWAVPRDRRGQAAAATLAYAALTVVLTWPLARGLTHDIPGDFGDPLLNCWILAWDATHFGRGWWSANIFHPHPLSLAYSEHLAAQAVEILPIYRATGNAILCYNLLFLSTFVLSGLGVFLLVRELTGDFRASWVAGVAYAFAPYRFASVQHIQVLSAAWMPFVLFGLRRYFAAVTISRSDDARAPRLAGALPLAGAVSAWVLQNLSCGYYLVFFAPAVALYLVWEITTRGLWSSARVIATLVIVSTAVGAATAPFLLPYLELRHLGFDPRSIAETRKFSSDVYGYFTADPSLRVWGSIMRAWPRAEGALFPGLTIVALGLVGVVNGAVSGDRGGRGRTTFAGAVLMVGGAVAMAIVLALMLGWTIRLPGLKITSLPRALTVAGLGTAAGLALSRETRARFTTWARSPAAGFGVVTLFAVLMSFGPEIRAMDRVVSDHNLYEVFYRAVPGFDGLRVPARYGMLVALGLAVLAGLGLADLAGPRPSPNVRLERGVRPPGRAWIYAVAALLIVVDSFAVPIPINQNSSQYQRRGLAALPPLEHEAPPVYTFVASLPPAAVIVELPLGEPAFDVRYMYFSARHWRRLVNGYSGGQPPDYELLDMALQELATEPLTAATRAWRALSATPATHAIVHQAYYGGDLGKTVGDWMRANGAREIAVYGADHVFQMP